MPDTTFRSSSPGVGELFQLLRDGKPKTRAELASACGLARSTVAARIEALLDCGLVAVVDDLGSTGGRPPARVVLNPDAGLMLAIDLGATHGAVGLVDLGGTIRARDHEHLLVTDGPEFVLDRVVDMARKLLGSIDRTPSDLIAAAIGVPGPVEFATGRPSNPPIMPGWDGFDIPAWIREHLHVPTLVDNDVNVMAVGERARAFPDTADLIFVKVATGIGAGIIAGGALQRGAGGIAGDIGHVRAARGSDVACTCGNIGCLEAVASGSAVARQLRATGRDVSSTAEGLKLVRDGDVDAIQAVRQAGRDLGEVLAACVNLINPSVIVIGGSLAQAGEHLLAGVREVVYSRSTPLAAEHLAIVQSSAGPDAGIIGAGALALDSALSADSVNALAA
jgi:glucokinase